MADKVAFPKREHVRNAEDVAHKIAFIQLILSKMCDELKIENVNSVERQKHRYSASS